MSVIGVHGLPGQGKTLLATALAIKQYRKSNTLVRRIIRKKLGVPSRLNLIYSNYSILLDKKRNVYSNIVSIDDCNNDYSFFPNSSIIIDEVQAFYDSYRDFKNFPRSVSSFFQFHRHFGIKDIYLISQSPRRVVTYLRDVTSVYWRIKKFIKIPFIPLGVIYYRICYEFDHYDWAFTRSKEEIKRYDISSKLVFFSTYKVFNSFKSKYLNMLNINSELCKRGQYKSKAFPKKEIDYLYNRLFKQR